MSEFHLVSRQAVLAAIILASSAQAQQVPDAGRLLEEVRPAPALPQRELPKIEIDEAPGSEIADGLRIPVTHVRITGATLFPESDLHALIADAEGKELALGDLRALAARLTQHYRSHGYLLARAYLPAQDVKNGEVNIGILEGRLGQIEIHNGAGIGGAALAPLSPLGEDAVTRDSTLERGLLLLSDVPGVEVKSTLRPGATPGTSDLLVDVAPGRRITGSVDADNFGDRFSGQSRLGATANVNNPLQLGDQVSLRAVVSDEGMTYVRGSYQLPVNRWGTRVGLAASDVHYHLGKSVAVLDATGEARTSSLYLQHPLIRSRSLNLNGQFQYDHMKLGDRIGQTSTVVNKTLDNWTAGLSGDFQDGLGGGGANSFSVAYTGGHLALDAASDAIDAASAGSSGNFGKWNLSWLRLQRLTDDASVYFSGIGQVAVKNLDSSEKLSLGGANGVRAYPQGEAPSDEGLLMILEARYSLPNAVPGALQLAAFVDGGHVRLHKNTWAPGPNRRTLSGAGFGLNWMVSNDWQVKASIAWKLGDESPVSDIDRSPRAWLQGVKFF
jgi:hemolysin activation/secretion protein